MTVYRNLTRSIRQFIREFRIPKMLTFRFYQKILWAPVRWFIENRQKRRIRDFFLGMPALIGLIAVPVLYSTSQLKQSSLSAEYVQEAKLAIDNEQYPRAELLLNRVLRRQDSGLSEAQFLMAVLFEETNQKGRASELFQMLAPDNAIGHNKAHQRLAGILADTITWKSDPRDLNRLYWHLTAAGNSDSAAISIAWGKYWLATGDLKAARESFLKAVNQFPELWQTLGAIETQSGHQTLAVSSYNRSSEYLSKQLVNDPTNGRVRIDYVQVLMKLGKLEKAQRILDQGRLMDPEGPWTTLLASLAVSFHDLKSTQNTPISELLSYLDRALKYDPNHGPALNRLMAYATANVEGNADLKTILAKVIAEAKQPGLAHLAMGNLCWLEDNRKQAVFHFNRAMEFRKDMPVLLNNMAWLIAHDEKKPDLERAMGLIQSAIENRPEDLRFLDTRGSIYFLQEDWESALTDLEKSLTVVKDKKAVHRKLDVIYTKLELPEIAEQHRLMAEEMTIPEVTNAANR